jgi:hypothetical protein
LANLRPPADQGDNGFECVGDVTFYDRNPFIIDTLEKVEIDSFKLHIFKDFIASAQAKDIQVVVSFSPVSRPLSQRTLDLLRYYKSMLNEMDVAFFDFVEPAYQDKQLFIDLIHMDGVGAELFSREFGARLDSLRHQSILVSEL